MFWIGDELDRGRLEAPLGVVGFRGEGAKMPARGLSWYLAVVPIALAFVADWVIYRVWGQVEQQPASTVRALAIADLMFQTGLFMIASYVVLADAGLQRTLKVTMMVALTMVTMAWSGLRLYGAAWGGLRFDVARALGLGVRGYAFLPLVGHCLGVGLYFAWRKRSR